MAGRHWSQYYRCGIDVLCFSVSMLRLDRENGTKEDVGEEDVQPAAVVLGKDIDMVLMPHCNKITCLVRLSRF